MTDMKRPNNLLRCVSSMHCAVFSPHLLFWRQPGSHKRKAATANSITSVFFFLTKNTANPSLPQIRGCSCFVLRSPSFIGLFHVFAGEEGGCGVCERRLGGGGPAVQGGRSTGPGNGGVCVGDDHEHPVLHGHRFRKVDTVKVNAIVN